MSDSIEALGPKREARLQELETTIDSGLRAFVRVGTALTEIRNEQLYRPEHDTFQDYCERRWEMSRGHAYRLIEAAEVVAKLREVSPKGDTPKHETHVRALAPLKDRPKEMAEAWREARGGAPEGEPTAVDVQKAVERRTERETPPGEHPPRKVPERPGAEPTSIQTAVRETLPDDEGTHHYTEGQAERLHWAAREADHGIVCVRPTGRRNGELRLNWKKDGDRQEVVINRHGNPPEGIQEVA